MSEHHENLRIRRGLALLMDEAPVAPEFEDLTTTRAVPSNPRRPRPVAALISAAAVTSVFAAGGIWVAQSGGPSVPAAQPSTETTSAESTTPSTTAAPPEQEGRTTPIDIEAVASEFLADIPLPEGVDPSEISSSFRASDLERILEEEQVPEGLTRAELDRYFIGAHVAGAATCAWIEVWLDSSAGDDQERADGAVSALATSRSWSVLAEMNPIGDYPEVIWEYADAVAGDGTVPAGYPGATVAETYVAALGCPTP